jgi:ATPase family AAA domain-containing protein 1
LTKNALSTLQGTLADPDKEKHEQARIRAEANLSRIRKSRENNGVDGDDSGNSDRKGPRIEDLALNEYENMVALEVVAPEDIPVGFDGKIQPVRISVRDN